MRRRQPETFTRETIKSAARRLFATRGIDGVSVREIVAASQQKNGGSLHYHFGTKEALVRELIIDGAKFIDDRRNAIFDQMEKDRRRPGLREIIEILVWPSTNLDEKEGGEGSYIRFINVLQANHRGIFMEALDGRWNSGYMKCINHLQQILSDIPQPLLNQRLVFMGIYLTSAMAAREASLDDRQGSHPFWVTPTTMENFIDTMENLLRGPISEHTRELMTHPGSEVGAPRREYPTSQPAKPTAQKIEDTKTKRTGQ